MGGSLDYITLCHLHRSHSRKRKWEPLGGQKPPGGCFGWKGRYEVSLAHLPQEQARESVPGWLSPRGHGRCQQELCVTAGLGALGRGDGKGGRAGGWAGSGPAQHPAQPWAGSLQDQALCYWLPPKEGWQGTLGTGRSRACQSQSCARSCCWPRACISSPPPQPFSLYFYKYIYKIYMMQSAIETRPRVGREVLVSPSPLRL